VKPPEDFRFQVGTEKTRGRERQTVDETPRDKYKSENEAVERGGEGEREKERAREDNKARRERKSRRDEEEREAETLTYFCFQVNLETMRAVVPLSSAPAAEKKLLWENHPRCLCGRFLRPYGDSCFVIMTSSVLSAFEFLFRAFFFFLCFSFFSFFLFSSCSLLSLFFFSFPSSFFVSLTHLLSSSLGTS
jgi:hypothetical protein